MNYLGYDFCFTIGDELIILPITPSELEIKVGSNNKVVTLINEGDVNILKSPSLVEFKFDARFPMRQYPYSRPFLNFDTYLNKFTALKTEKRPFKFSVIRRTPDGANGTWGTYSVVSLEELTVKESADDGDDVILSFKLKEYKGCEVKTLNTSKTVPTSTSTSETPRSTTNKKDLPTDYVVQKGDCLWNIAKKYYGKGSKWKTIYNANKTIIEKTANKYRKGKGSSNGNYIYPGTKLTIPKA